MYLGNSIISDIYIGGATENAATGATVLEFLAEFVYAAAHSLKTLNLFILNIQFDFGLK